MSKKKPDLSEVRKRLNSKKAQPLPLPKAKPFSLDDPLLKEMADTLMTFIEPPVRDDNDDVFNKDERTMIVGAKVTGSLSKDSRIIVIKINENYVPNDVPLPEIWVCLKMAGKYARPPIMHWKNTKRDVLNYDLSDQAMRAASELLEKEHGKWLERYYSLEVV
jgi:hypothetical protein